MIKMENRFFFTLCSDRFSDEILLETSGDLPAGELLADILKVLNWPAEVDGKPVKYLLRSEDREIQLSESLVSAGSVILKGSGSSRMRRKEASVEKWTRAFPGSACHPLQHRSLSGRSSPWKNLP